jgi:hypothetical protein
MPELVDSQPGIAEADVGASAGGQNAYSGRGCVRVGIGVLGTLTFPVAPLSVSFALSDALSSHETTHVHNPSGRRSTY